MLKTKASGQICVSASYAKTNREPGVFRNSLTEQRPHSQQDFAADFCELEIVFWKKKKEKENKRKKKKKAPEQCRQHILHPGG